MSNFIDNIQEKFTGRYFQKIRAFRPLERLTAETAMLPVLHDRYMEYIFEVHWKLKVNIAEEDPKAKEYMFANALHQLKRDVYGDFVDDLIALERAIYSGEDKVALQLVKRLLSDATA